VLKVDNIGKSIEDIDKEYSDYLGDDSVNINNFNWCGEIELDLNNIYAAIHIEIVNGELEDVCLDDKNTLTIYNRKGEPIVFWYGDKMSSHKSLVKFILFNTKGVVNEIVVEAYRKFSI